VLTLAIKSCKKDMAKSKQFGNLPKITENDEKNRTNGLMGSSFLFVIVSLWLKFYS
jgi:hypothetical protein